MTSEPGVYASQVTCTVVEALEQTPPSGTGPSPTVSVSVTTPGAVQVKFVFAALAAENVPLGADHA